MVSGQVLARYEICLARYLTILDGETEKNEKKYFFGLFNREAITRADLVTKAWERLTCAEQHLTVRMIKYHIVDEVSQATFQPYYQLLAYIYLQRAKLFIWYPFLVAPANALYRPPTQTSSTSQASPEHACKGRLFLLERARVYAACDGDSALYVTCTTYQCWVWLMTALIMPGKELTFQGKSRVSKQDCLAWAQQLRNHALLHYAPIGQRCYHAIKEKSGLSKKLAGTQAKQRHTYGHCQIDSIPAIRETVNEGQPGYDPDNEVLYLDMGYLADGVTCRL